MYLMILLLMDRYEEFLVWGAYLVYLLSPMKEQQSRRSNWWLSGGDNRYAHAADLNESLTCTSSLEGPSKLLLNVVVTLNFIRVIIQLLHLDEGACTTTMYDDRDYYYTLDHQARHVLFALLVHICTATCYSNNRTLRLNQKESFHSYVEHSN